MGASLLLGLGWIIFQVLYLYKFAEKLPEKMVTHFDINGVANGWMSRSQHFIFFIVLVIFLNAVFFGLSFVIGKFQSLKLVNIPWKSYWTQSPEHMQKALVKIRYFLWGGGFLMNLILLGTQSFIASQNGLDSFLNVSPNLFTFGVMILTLAYILWSLILFKPRQ